LAPIAEDFHDRASEDDPPTEAQLEDLTDISKRITAWGRRPGCAAVGVCTCLALRACCCRDKPETLAYVEDVGVLGQDCRWFELEALARHLDRMDRVVFSAIACFLVKEEHDAGPRFGLCWTKDRGYLVQALARVCRAGACRCAGASLLSRLACRARGASLLACLASR